MYRVSATQCKDNHLLNLIDDYIYSEDLKIENGKIFISLDIQRELIQENFTKFSDITEIMEDMKKIQDVTVTLVNSATKEEKEVMIEIEGGV